MFLFSRKKYDLIFGIGEACSCSTTLRRGNLQIQSFPFDWLYGSTFLARINLLTQDFDGIIRLEDLEFKGNNGIPAHLCDIYHNKSNNLGFNHDFESGVNPAEVIDKISAKYKRRAERLLKIAEHSENILAVWIDSPGSNWVKKNDEDFIEGQKSLQKKFPNARVELIVITWEKGLSYRNRTKKRLNENIIKYSFDYQFHHKKKVIADYVVDEKMLLKIFDKYELKMTIKEKLNNYFFKKRKK